MKSEEMIRAQETLTGEIFVDNFAGGGGASTGIEMALGKTVNIAVNHDPAAILMHKTNHPYTEHYQASVWDIDPQEVCRGRPAAGAWFSPDCKHFSKAKGSALVNKRIRGLAWITLRWAALVRPRVIFLENVEEFQTWGPVRKGKPVKKLAGTTFRKFIGQLQELGYAVEWRELVAADYGAPTTRKRFVMIARCDGRLICWPAPTHASRDSEAFKRGKLPPWRSAAEIIDWSLPCPSIFASKAEIKAQYGLNAVRPLAENTMRRIIRGVDKFTIRGGEPFLVEANHTGGTCSGSFRGGGVRNSVGTVTARLGRGVCDPLLAPVTVSNTGGSVGGDAGMPVHTVRTGGGGQMLAAPSLIQYHAEQTGRVRASGLGGPIHTVDASNRYGLTAANLVEYYGNGKPLDPRVPMHTATSHDREALATAHIAKYYGGVIGAEAGDPLPTVTAVDHNALVASHTVKFKGANLGSSPADPVQTETAGGGTFAMCKVHLCKIRPEDNGCLNHWPEIRALLNRHCGYQLCDDDLLLLEIGLSLYYIADIGLRMLTPRELYNAMGFPPDYITDRDYTGKPYPKNEQVARCGNAVCPPVAAAVVAAQFPEYVVKRRITTMEELIQEVAV